MTDAPPRPVPVTVPATLVNLDRPRWLVEDFDALAAFEEKTGLNARDTQVMENLNVTNKAVLVWAYLHRDDPDLTIEHTRELLSQAGYSVLVDQALLELTNIGLTMAAEALGLDPANPGGPSGDGGGGGEDPLSTGGGPA